MVQHKNWGLYVGNNLASGFFIFGFQRRVNVRWRGGNPASVMRVGFRMSMRRWNQIKGGGGTPLHPQYSRMEPDRSTARYVG